MLSTLQMPFVYFIIEFLEQFYESHIWKMTLDGFRTLSMVTQ